MPCNGQNQPKVNSTIPTRQLFQTLPGNNQGTNSSLPGNALSCPPIHIYSNFNHQPGTRPSKFDLNSDFPPLAGTHTNNQKHILTQPAEPKSIPSSPKSHWNQLFASNRVKANGTNLNFIPNKSQEGSPAITISPDEVQEELSRWKNALVGYVIGAKPPFKLMQQFVDRRWKAFGKIELFILKAGIFIFNFQDEETKAKVLELGPWSYFDKPLILKPWSPSESYDRVEPDCIPIWVRLPQLKLHLWSATTLSKLGSQIGRPLFTDRMTSLRQRLAYARICVEVSRSSTFPSAIEIVDHDGTSFSQQIEYEWVPTFCDNCKQFGHKLTQCKRNSKKEWRPVSKVIDKEEPKTQRTPPQAESMNPMNEDAKLKGELEHQANSRGVQSPSKALVISNKFSSLEGHEQEEALSIIPLATDNSSLAGDMSTLSMKGKEVIEINSPTHKEVPPLSPAAFESSPNEEDIPLSKAQRKRKEKMQHAIESKNKASKAKSSTPSPPPK